VNSVNWTNPYTDRAGPWLRGNLHTHTSPGSGCGTVPLERVLDLYADAGYDFLAISDHMNLTPADSHRLVVLPGIEWNSPHGEHTGVYSCDESTIRAALAIRDQEELLSSVGGDGALVVLNHPNWQLRPHYRREELESKHGFDGIEIYNGVIERLARDALATDKWDYLLTKGHRVLGFASDDSHLESDIGIGWIIVRARERTAGSILAGLKTGNFYCSTGVTLLDVRREGDLVEIESEEGQEIQVIGREGRLIEKIRDRSVSYDLARTESPYVRFAVYGPGASVAWTQPFFKC